MKELINKFKRGVKVELGKNKAVISSDLMNFQDYYYITADIIENVDFTSPCSTLKIHDNVALIIRNKELMQKIGFSVDERRAIYCHELGHIFSKNQLDNKKSSCRKIDDEIDSDTFAVKECKIEPEVLENALKKTYKYEINQITQKENMSQERVERFVNEMSQRKKNIEKLIREKNSISLE